MSSNVLPVTKIYINREDTLFPVSNKGAEIFSISYVLQMRIKYHRVRLHMDGEIAYF